jgi:hypothetical protein
MSSGGLPLRPTTTDVLLALGKVDAKVDAVKGKVDGLDKKVDRATGDHEARLRALEAARWPLRSLAAVAGIAALVVPFLVTWH